jgi:hypothetical protein
MHGFICLGECYEQQLNFCSAAALVSHEAASRLNASDPGENMRILG